VSLGARPRQPLAAAGADTHRQRSRHTPAAAHTNTPICPTARKRARTHPHIHTDTRMGTARVWRAHRDTRGRTGAARGGAIHAHAHTHARAHTQTHTMHARARTQTRTLTHARALTDTRAHRRRTRRSHTLSHTDARARTHRCTHTLTRAHTYTRAPAQDAEPRLEHLRLQLRRMQLSVRSDDSDCLNSAVTAETVTAETVTAAVSAQ
jgi:hypothetical protein